MLTADARRRLLVLLLRFTGCVLIIAFLAIFLPVEWMASTHHALGMGDFPRAPVVDYLARSVAALYGFHGVLVLIVSGDPVRYRGIVSYLGIMNVLFGVTVFGIALHAGLPVWWTVLEGPPAVIIGIVVTVLNRSMRPQLRTV